MSFVQTTYSENIGVAFPGMPAHADFSALTYVAEEATGIGFGVAVSQGTADNQCKLGAAAATGFVGVAVRSIIGNSDTYLDKENVTVMQRGYIWVTVAADVNAGDNVTFLDTTGALSSAAADANNFAIAGARWMTSATSGNLAKLYLSGEMPSA